MLYPVRSLPTFLEKNIVSPEAVSENALLSSMIEAGDESVITVDAEGHFRFNPSFSSVADLGSALDRIASDGRWTALVDTHRTTTLNTYEDVFQHHGYTGRSGSMYGYEGIGSIFWHMVGKLLVAVQRSVVHARSTEAPESTVNRLIDAYWRVRAGLGFNKTAAEFGAIPLDPHSHSPAHAGAQQPGMTGLVKEELLTRPLEVGVRVEGGIIRVDPMLLRRSEFLQAGETWTVLSPAMHEYGIELAEQSLGSTVCQVPIIVALTDDAPELEVTFTDGRTGRIAGLELDRETSREIFGRTGRVHSIRATVPIHALRDTER